MRINVPSEGFEKMIKVFQSLCSIEPGALVGWLSGIARHYSLLLEQLARGCVSGNEQLRPRID